MFKQAVVKWAEKYETADGREFGFGKTTIRFFQPVPHGEDESGLGWVLLCIVEKSGEKIIFAPDVQGPISEETVNLILSENPDVLIMGGPPTYLKGFRIADSFFQKALLHMEQIAEKIPTLVIDHHLLRDADWHKFLQPVRDASDKNGHALLTAAELIKKEPRPLECRRKELYDEEKPAPEFMKWTKLSKEKLSETPPPL